MHYFCSVIKRVTVPQNYTACVSYTRTSSVSVQCTVLYCTTGLRQATVQHSSVLELYSNYSSCTMN